METMAIKARVEKQRERTGELQRWTLERANEIKRVEASTYFIRRVILFIARYTGK